MAIKGYGEILKRAREEKGFSYAELHKILKMDPSYIKALEDENMAHFEKPIYMKLFLKTYSRFLKLDTAEMMEMFDYSPEVVEAEKKDRIKPKERIVVGDIIKETEPRELESVNGIDLTIMSSKNIIMIGAGIAVVIIAAILVFVFAGKSKPAAQAAAANIYTATVTAPATLNITIHAKEDVWMKARYEGSPEDDFLLKKGEDKNYKDINRIVFLVGNAGGVEFTVNGDSIGAIGEAGEVINGLIFEAGKNWYIDKSEGFKRGNHSRVEDTPTQVPAPTASAPKPAVEAPTASTVSAKP
jgi:transcriptional regulator with XRE-family HTH domain